MKKKIEIQNENEKDQVDLQEAADNADSETHPAGNSVDTSNEDNLATKLEAAEQQAQDHYDRLLRVSAEFDNYKKRTTREMGELGKYANEKLVKELLTVVDNLERAIESAAKDYSPDDPLVQGVNLTLTEVLKILERHHVKPIVALGEVFDPKFHQAMMQEEVGDKPANTVVREMQKGYLIHERLLRPAMVAVSKANDKQTESND